MIKVWICDAAKDENGKDGYEGSLPGNQHKLTGDPKFPDECRTIKYADVREFWWKNRETQVFRCKREDIANAMAIRMKQVVDNKYVGYSQKNRTGVYDNLVNDPDPSHIKRKVECDCSGSLNAVVWVTFKTAAHPETDKIKPLARTKDMPAMYSKIDEFENVTGEIDLSNGKGLKKGDILVIPNNHTAMVWEVINEDDPDIPYEKGFVAKQTDLRIGPGTKYDKCNIQIAPDYKVRDYLYAGEEAKIIAKNGDWFQVLCVGDENSWTPWANNKNIVIDDTGKYKYGIVNVSKLYLRIGPSTIYQKCNIQIPPDNKIRNYLEKGEVVKILSEQRGWYQIECKGKYTWTPWVSGAYVTVVEKKEV